MRRNKTPKKQKSHFMEVKSFICTRYHYHPAPCHHRGIYFIFLFSDYSIPTLRSTLYVTLLLCCSTIRPFFCFISQTISIHFMSSQSSQSISFFIIDGAAHSLMCFFRRSLLCFLLACPILFSSLFLALPSAAPLLPATVYCTGCDAWNS